MGFFDALRRVLGGSRGAVDPALARAWGLNESADGEEASTYDLSQWVKRLKRLLNELPASEPEWAELTADARALHFDDAWLAARCRDEFRMLVRGAVADRKFTEEEHRKIDLARDLMGIPEAEAETILHEVVAEAETFFGRTVEEV